MRLTRMHRALLAATSIPGLAFAISTPAFSEATCKGLEQAVCETTESCRWQAGYTRKDGIEVSSHCRSSGKAKEVSPEVSAKDEPDKTS